MTTTDIQAIPGVIKVLEGKAAGKEVVIIAGIHGNETCGVKAFEKLLPTLSIDAGRVTFVLGNLKALEAGNRFTEQNLNRLFKADDLITDAQKQSYEYTRSRELMPLLQQADAVLDIHSSGTVGSTPFVICNRDDVANTKLLPFSIVSYGWDAIEPGATDEYVHSVGGVGMGIECGYHEDPDAIGRAEESIQAFLALFGALRDMPTIPTPSTCTYVAVTDIHHTKTNFTPAKSFKDFEPVAAGAVIGTDGEEEITVPSAGVVIFVRTRQNPDEEAFIFGQIQ